MRSVRNTVVFGPVLQLMVVVAASRLRLALELFYIVLFLMLAVQVYFFERDNPGERVIDTRTFTIGEAPRQVVGGGVVGLLAGLPAVLYGVPRIGPSFAADVVTQVLFVAFVETAYLLVVVNTLWVGDFRAGVFVWPPLFGVLHVRDEVLAGAVTWDTGLRFLYAATFGILFWVLYAGRTMPLPRWLRRYFGPVSTWTAHVVVNLLVIAFLLRLWGLELFALVVR